MGVFFDVGRRVFLVAHERNRQHGNKSEGEANRGQELERIVSAMRSVLSLREYHRF